MTAALIILTILVVVGAALYVHDRLTRNKQVSQSENSPEEPTEAADSTSDEGCCGMHITCEKDSLSTAVGDEVVYYDDEELDVYAGRESVSYNQEEIDQFRDILFTLLPTDIAGWARSLQLRGIELPYEVREELLLIVAEARSANKTTSAVV